MTTSYFKRRVTRAKTDTVKFFGWNRRTLFFAVTSLIVIGATWFVSGWDTSALDKAIVPVVVTIASAVLVFIWNWFAAPARMQKDADEQISALDQRLNKIKNKQDSVDRLSDLLDAAIHNIWNQPVSNDDDLAQLQAKWKQWQKEVEALLENDFTKSDLIHFRRLGVIPPVERIDAFDDNHAKIIREYALKESRLREIIRDHNVTHIS